MAVERQKMTVEQFEALAELPEHADRRLEYIGGEIAEVPSNPFASMIAALILAEIVLYLKQHRIGRVTGADGGYRVMGERYAPDVAFISYARQPQLPQKGYNPNPPELAVEVISDENAAQELNTLLTKVANYIAAGTVVWVVYPVSAIIRVHVPNQPVKILYRDDTLDGGAVLPGFRLPLSAVFPAE